MKNIIIGLLFISTIFISCSKSGYTMNISQAKLQENIQKSFPLKKDLAIGTLHLNKPILKLDEKINKIITGLDFAYKPPFFPKQSGLVSLSGAVKYDKEKAAFFLQNPQIEQIKFNNTSLGKVVPDSLKNVLRSFVNELFLKYPIYKISDDSLKGKLYKNTLKKVEVKNGNLQLTLGL